MEASPPPGREKSTVNDPVQRSSGGNKLVWLAVIVALGIVLAYAAGMLQ